MSGFVGFVGCDPGGTTGLAWVIGDHDRLLEDGALSWLRSFGGVERDVPTWGIEWGMFACDEVKGRVSDQAREVYDLACEVKGVVGVFGGLAIESFQLRPGLGGGGAGVDLSSERIISMLDSARAFGQDCLMEKDVYKYSASEHKSLITDERLKRWGLWVPGRKDAREAVRVLVHHVRKVVV